MDQTKYKICSRCLKNKKIIDYYKRANNDLPRSKCKECQLAENKEKRRIKRKGKRKGAWYDINQDVINDNSLNTWYYVGLLAADGSIISKGNRVKITLHKDDLSTIESFKNHFGYSGPLRCVKNGQYVGCEFTGVPIIVDKLMNDFNIVPNKTNILEPPKNIPSVDHALSYIIGYIDGDGCIFRSKYGHTITIIGTYKILAFIKSVFSCYSNITGNIRKIKNTNQVYVFSVGGNFKTGKHIYLGKKLLSLNLPKMKRKWDKLEFDK